MGAMALRAWQIAMFSCAIVGAVGAMTVAPYFVWHEQQGCRRLQETPAIGRLVQESTPTAAPIELPVGVRCEWTVAGQTIVAESTFFLPNALLVVSVVATVALVGLFVHEFRMSRLRDGAGR